MAEITHSPGPWTAEKIKGVPTDYLFLLNANGEVLGHIWMENPANAPVIVAAPELLAALKDIVHDADRDYKKAEHLGDKIGMLNAKHMRVIAWRAIRKVEPGFL